MDLHLEGKAALITGGSRGIGRAIALGFAREGARVAICGRTSDLLDQTKGMLEATGAKAIALRADLTSSRDCDAIVRATREAFGRVDILVNNASPAPGPEPHRPEVLGEDRLLARVNSKSLATILCATAVIPHMKAIGGGRIICIAGTPARAIFRDDEMPVSATDRIAAGLSNALIVNFARQLADRLGPNRILVNVVHPHVVRTDRFAPRIRERARELEVSESEAEARLATHIPIRRIIEPTDIAPLVLFLASDAASAITGQSIAVDGGASRAIIY